MIRCSCPRLPARTADGRTHKYNPECPRHGREARKAREDKVIGCRHKFIGTKCLHCGKPFATLKAESEAELAALGGVRSRPHDFKLEPTDDSIASLQHAVAVARETNAGDMELQRARELVMQRLGENRLLLAGDWLFVARLAMQAYEATKEAEG